LTDLRRAEAAGAAQLAAEQLIGRRIADEALPRRVPLKLAASGESDVAKMGDGGRGVAGGHVARALAPIAEDFDKRLGVEPRGVRALPRAARNARLLRKLAGAR
jgi:hypothetical protein